MSEFPREKSQRNESQPLILFLLFSASRQSAAEMATWHTEGYVSAYCTQTLQE